MYSKVGVLKKLDSLGSRFEKAVDAIVWNQAQNTIALANKVINQQEEILRRFHVMHQGDNYGDSEDERGFED